MSFIAEFSVEIPPLAQASEAVPEMEFSGEDIVLEGDRPHKFVFTAHGDRFEAFEAALETDPTVKEYTVLTRLAETAYYVVTYTDETDTQGTYHVAVEQNIAYMNLRLQDGTYHVRARVPNRTALGSLREYCEKQGIPFRLERIFHEDSSNAQFGLTDAQETALRQAYEHGYFDSPRQTDLSVIGDELGISRQAVADRLRRGHKRLIETTLI